MANALDAVRGTVRPRPPPELCHSAAYGAEQEPLTRPVKTPPGHVRPPRLAVSFPPAYGVEPAGRLLPGLDPAAGERHLLRRPLVEGGSSNRHPSI
jgi:hypothetical protein